MEVLKAVGEVRVRVCISASWKEVLIFFIFSQSKHQLLLVINPQVAQILFKEPD